MRILIADDDETSRVLLEGMLGKWGYAVVSTTNGLEAWTALEQDDAPKLAVLDWVMPGLDGIDICRKVAALDRPNPPYIILLTALDAKENLAQGLAAGAADYIAKPFSHIELEARIRVGERVVRLQRALHGRALALQEALDHVKTLQGILPICVHCRRVRNDQESWDRLETYIEAHFDTQFSHGLCPECLEIHYPVQEANAADGDDLSSP